jgi:hypothetical protein
VAAVERIQSLLCEDRAAALGGDIPVAVDHGVMSRLLIVDGNHLLLVSTPREEGRPTPSAQEARMTVKNNRCQGPDLEAVLGRLERQPEILRAALDRACHSAAASGLDQAEGRIITVAARLSQIALRRWQENSRRRPESDPAT